MAHQRNRSPPGPEGPAREKIPETDAIFGNVRASRERAAREPDTLRISLDTKAKVKVGDFSRGGRARGTGPVKAVDHDMSPEALLVPLGILELNRGGVEVHQPWISFGHSRETSDFIADGLEQQRAFLLAVDFAYSLPDQHQLMI